MDFKSFDIGQFILQKYPWRPPGHLPSVLFLLSILQNTIITLKNTHNIAAGHSKPRNLLKPVCVCVCVDTVEARHFSMPLKSS